MRRPFLIRSALIAAVCVLGAGSAAAQSWGHNTGHGHYRGGSNAAPSAFDWPSQLDRPGDYRCDAFWDANRSDCDARWRDQRRRVSDQARRDYRSLAGYGHNDGRYAGGYGRGLGHPYATRRRGYGGYGYNQGYGQPVGTAWHGAYGRPDLVYPGGSGGYAGQGHAGGRDPGRVDWCRARYRSYDSRSGYYRTYSGRLVFCG